MAYATASRLKEERKKGMKAMKSFMKDPQSDQKALDALNIPGVQQAFFDIDLMNDIDFVEKMEDLRENNPEVYALFWWWREAEYKNGFLKEGDGEDAEDAPRYKCFQIVQFLAEPFSSDWEDDRRTLKPGIQPLITEEQIADGLTHQTIKRWAWIWHDCDVYTAKDEAADESGLIKAGERKFKHVHIAIDLGNSKKTRSVIAKWFGVPCFLVRPAGGRGAFEDLEEYWVHESPAAMDDEKTHYDDDKMHVNPGNDFRADLNRLQSNRLKYGKRAEGMTAAETMKMHVLNDGWSMRRCREEDPLTYASIRSTLPPLRLDYLSGEEPPSLRINIYIDGPSGVGKSVFSEFIAERLAGPRSYFSIGNDERVLFDGYDGEPVIIWDDMRVTDFIRHFGPNGTYRLLDPHPKLIAEQAKFSKVILNNSWNIINGIQPYAEFIAGLAGSYTDRFGVDHEAEDEIQSWRRFPVILCLHEDDFDVLVNRGFIDRGSRAYQSMMTYASFQGGLRKLCQMLGGEAKEKTLRIYGEPVMEVIDKIKESEDDKITDPELIPADLIPRRRTPEELAERQKQIDKERNKSCIERLQEQRERREAMMPDFIKYFWSQEAADYVQKVGHPDTINPPSGDSYEVKRGRLRSMGYEDMRFFCAGFTDTLDNPDDPKAGFIVLDYEFVSLLRRLEEALNQQYQREAVS